MNAVSATEDGLSSVGFTRNGVKRRSAASKWQSLQGSVSSGSFFSKCQRAGAGGLSPGVTAAIGIVGAIFGAISAAVETSSDNRSRYDN